MLMLETLKLLKFFELASYLSLSLNSADDKTETCPTTCALKIQESISCLHGLACRKLDHIC